MSAPNRSTKPKPMTEAEREAWDARVFGYAKPVKLTDGDGEKPNTSPIPAAPRWEYGYFLNSGWGLFLSTQRTERGTVDDTTVADFYGSADDAQAECDRRNTLTSKEGRQS